MTQLSKMLAAQHQLQVESFGHALEDMPMKERIEYIRWNVVALEHELHEFLDELSWKPWTSGELVIDRPRALKELIDAWHFFMNLLLAISPGDRPQMIAHEFASGYHDKRQINAQRQINGYDGVSTKCPHCKRALDEPDALTRVDMPTIANPERQHYWHCSSCGQSLTDEVVAALGEVQSTT